MKAPARLALYGVGLVAAFGAAFGLSGIVVPDSYVAAWAEQSETAAVRSVFIIDPKKKIRLTMTYPMSVGRNFDEILRVIDSLQLTDSHKVATPANWKDGDDVVIVPSLQDPAELAQRFPKGWNAVRPYLRITPQPNK